MEDNPGAEVLFGGTDEDVGVDGFSWIVGGFIEFDLDLG